MTFDITRFSCWCLKQRPSLKWGLMSPLFWHKWLPLGSPVWSCSKDLAWFAVTQSVPTLRLNRGLPAWGPSACQLLPRITFTKQANKKIESTQPPLPPTPAWSHFIGLCCFSCANSSCDATLISAVDPHQWPFIGTSGVENQAIICLPLAHV